jgi:tetratricopeptide (TPR) repeat protein
VYQYNGVGQARGIEARWNVASEAHAERGDPATVFIGLALVVGTLAVFGPVYANDFVNYDDPQYVTANPHVKAGLSGEGVRWAFTSTEVLNWHPLTWLSLQLDASLYGSRPWGYHQTNLLLHAANALLLFLVLWRLTAAVWRSAAVAALFAVHPLHVESVAWVAERKDVLSTFFGLLALAAYVRYVERPTLSRYLPVAGAMVLSLMAKPMLVTLPAILLLLDYWPLGRLGIGRPAPLRLVLGEKIPLLALAVASAVLTVFAQHQGGAIESLETLPLGLRAGNAVVSYVRYLGLALWPVSLAPFYPHPRAALPAWQVAGAAALLAAVTALTLASYRRRPYLTVGWLWYVITLVPVIGVVQVGEQALADRYTYVPLIGPFVMMAWGLADLLAQRPALKTLLAPAAVASVLACAILTWRQTTFWRDGRTLWEHTLRVTTDNYLAENNLGAACLFGQGTPQEAEQHLRNAVRMHPDYWRAHARLGMALDQQGKLDEAIASYSQSLALQPDQPSTRNNQAIVLGKRGRLPEAIAQLEEATRLDPGFAEAYQNLALALARAGRPDEAIEACRQCVRLKPRSAKYRLTLASLLRQRGDDEAADAEYRAAEGLRGYSP